MWLEMGQQHTKLNRSLLLWMSIVQNKLKLFFASIFLNQFLNRDSNTLNTLKKEICVLLSQNKSFHKQSLKACIPLHLPLFDVHLKYLLNFSTKVTTLEVVPTNSPSGTSILQQNEKQKLKTGNNLTSHLTIYFYLARTHFIWTKIIRLKAKSRFVMSSTNLWQLQLVTKKVQEEL